MTDFAALSSIMPAAPGLDPLAAPGVGAPNLQTFGLILAETIDAPVPAAAPPAVVPPLAGDDRSLATGNILPEGCAALPCGLAEQAGGPAQPKSERSGEGVTNRDAVRAFRTSRTAASAPDLSAPVQTAGEGEAKSRPLAGPREDSEAVDLPLLASAVAQPRAPLFPLASHPAETAVPPAMASTPSLPRSAPRLPPLPTVAVAIAATGRAAIDAPPVHPAGARPLLASAAQPLVEGLAAGDEIIPPAPAAPVDPIRTFSLSAAQLSAVPVVAVPNAGFRLFPVAIRAKILRDAEPAQPAIPAAASIAIRGFDDSRAIAPLPTAVQGFALSQPNALHTPNPTTAPAPAAPESRQDFVALVERLIDSRKALSPAPVQTALAHAEFGEITFRFAHDERGLSVAMASADPDFAPAVQAAMPAERPDRATHEQSRGQPGSGQPPGAQGAVDDRGGNHTAPQSRATPDRNARHAADPNPGSHEDDRPNRRAGIFA